MVTTSAPSMPHDGETRSPIGSWLLTAITLGVYAVVHHYLVNRELRDFGVDVRPVASMLALFPGVLLIVPAVITLGRTAERIGVAQETAGLERTASPPVAAIAILLCLFVPYEQRELNRVWRAHQ